MQPLLLQAPLGQLVLLLLHVQLRVLLVLLLLLLTRDMVHPTAARQALATRWGLCAECSTWHPMRIPTTSSADPSSITRLWARQGRPWICGAAGVRAPLITTSFFLLLSSPLLSSEISRGGLNLRCRWDTRATTRP